MELAKETFDAPAMLPLASGSATVAASAVARRAMHDTALWRAAEVSSETGQVGRQRGTARGSLVAAGAGSHVGLLG